MDDDWTQEVDVENVIDMQEKRQEKEKTTQKKQSAFNYSKIVLALGMRLRARLEGAPHYQQMHKHYMVATIDGERVPFRITDEDRMLCDFATVEEVASELSRWYQRGALFCENIAGPFARLDSGRGCMEAAERWLVQAPVECEGMPKPLAEEGAEEWSFGNLPPIVPYTWQDFGHCAPTLFEMANRCDRPDILAAWLYCALCDKGSKKQVLWLHGDANSGKSTLLGAVMARFLGERCQVLASSQWHKEYQWLEGDLLGSVYACTDEAGRYILRGERFKMITGSKYLMVQRKYQRAVKAEMRTRLAFVSNEAPFTGYDDALAKRINIVRIRRGYEPSPAEYESWIDEMAEQMPALLGYGRACLVDFGGSIPTQADVLAEDADEENAGWLEWIDETFVITNLDEDYVSLAAVQRLIANRVGGFATADKVVKSAYQELRKILLDKYQLRIINTRRDATAVRKVFVGIRVR